MVKVDAKQARKQLEMACRGASIPKGLSDLDAMTEIAFAVLDSISELLSGGTEPRLADAVFGVIEDCLASNDHSAFGLVGFGLLGGLGNICSHGEGYVSPDQVRARLGVRSTAFWDHLDRFWTVVFETRDEVLDIMETTIKKEKADVPARLKEREHFQEVAEYELPLLDPNVESDREARRIVMQTFRVMPGDQWVSIEDCMRYEAVIREAAHQLKTASAGPQVLRPTVG